MMTDKRGRNGKSREKIREERMIQESRAGGSFEGKWNKMVEPTERRER